MPYKIVNDKLVEVLSSSQNLKDENETLKDIQSMKIFETNNKICPFMNSGYSMSFVRCQGGNCMSWVYTKIKNVKINYENEIIVCEFCGSNVSSMNQYCCNTCGHVLELKESEKEGYCRLLKKD